MVDLAHEIIKYRNGNSESSVICQYVCQSVLFVQPIRSFNLISKLVLCLFMKITRCLLVFVQPINKQLVVLVSSLSAYKVAWSIWNRVVNPILFPWSCLYEMWCSKKNTLQILISLLLINFWSKLNSLLYWFYYGFFCPDCPLVYRWFYFDVFLVLFWVFLPWSHSST